MDEYDKKFAEMQKYIPFLEAMIERLHNVKDKDTSTREMQLQKMQGLHGILSDSKRKLKIETLQRCEDVLQKLYNKVEKGNGPGLQLSFKSNNDVTSQPSTSSKKTKSNQCNEVESTNAENDKGIEETPDSPDTIRSSSPDCQILPIEIPTERNRNRRQQEQQRSKVIPVITLTDPKTITISSPSDSNPDEVTFNEWDMLEESERHNSGNKGNRQPLLPVATSHDVTTAAKLISNSLPQKVSDNRNYALDPQDIPTVPVPSLGGSRRLSSVLEKNKLTLDIIASCSRSESPVNVPEVRLNSPDPEILFAKPPKPTSPRSKDSTLKPPSSKPPSIPLLFSPPPPLSHEPLLSMEDLAELLNDEGDGDKNNKTNENAKQKMDQISKNSVSEKEKLTSRKSLPNTAGISPVKTTSSIGPPRQSNDSHRSVPQAPFSKFQEPRYADNYERHPRQRDIHSHESTKDKLITISEEIPSQISVIHNIASKSDERNVSLYQRRSSVPSEGRKDASLPRPENEFVIDNDYYNMHANQIHWSSPTTTNDQFNNQWTPSSYGGMTNPPLQPTQHPFQRPMEPQFMQNQFPPALPAGPRSLINPTVRPDMSHVIRPENVREDIPPLMPPGFSSQYRGFQINQGSYDPAFPVGRPTEYPHIRPTWESTANSSYENVIPCGIQVVESTTGISHPRPNTPCPWGTTARDRERSNINQSRYYERNRIEVRPSFNRDGRRSDWSWDGHSDRENLNRFPIRDPRVRTEHNTTGVRDQAKETGVSARDPRLAKDKHVVNTSTKTKDSVLNERDPRKRLITTNTKTTTPATKEKQKSQKSPEKEKDKLPKDRMQSPLESLYGVIDTKASQNSGLQKFKIPKIKRPEPSQLNRIINEPKEVESISSKLSRAKSNKNKEQKKSNKLHSKNKSKDVESAEVSSSSDGNRATENSVQQNNVAKEKKSLSSSLKKSDKNETRIGEADSATINSKSSHIAKKGKTKESEVGGSKPKETVTKEWIESLIKESFQSGEGKKLVEHAKLLQKIGEVLNAKNFKKIKKIIESESESSSDKDETVEAEKTQVKKKRRVIMSDSSDDECLAERLSILSTNIDTNDARELASAISTDPKNSEENLEVTASSSNLSKQLTEDITAKKNDDLSESHDKEFIQVDNIVDSKNKDEQLGKKSNKNYRLENDNENTDIQPKSEKQMSSRLKDSDKEKKQTKDNQDNQVDQSTLEKSKDSIESSTECLYQDDIESNIEHLVQDKDSTTQSVVSDITNQAEEVSIDKPKAKTKRRNSLEMLQEDIREMFISEGVVMATGHRMCRISNSKKEETSSIAEKKITESNTETNESAANIAKRKSLRSRNVEESKSKAKSKDAKRMTRCLQSKKSIRNSDSEEDQPLALRTEKFLNVTDNSTQNQEVAGSEESNDAIRKSKRVLRKDIIKEPRVIVEKADLTKIDSSKIMFDSSSDESFGIDVSELAAAVDSSLRPEKQSDQDSMDTVIISRRRKNINNTGKRNFKSKKSSALTDDKSEDGSSFTDEESVISDISMSSNTTTRKKMSSSGAARTTAREELLSNILVGLVPTAEENTSVDKGNEADFEEDANDPVPIEPTVKKSFVRKKKKKSVWKMGRLTTKKRKKKTASAASSKTAQTNIETNTEPNISTDTVETNQSLLKDKDPVTDKIPEKILDDNHVVDHANVDSVEDKEVKPLVNMDNFDVDFKDSSNFTTLSEPLDTQKETLNDSFLSIEESKSFIKMDIKEEVSSSGADLTAVNAATGNKFFKESPKIVYDELMTELYRRIDIKHLIDYAWVGQDKYKCLLCFFMGKNIVHHYKTNHLGMEVLISRLKSTDAKTAIMDAERDATTTMDTSQICKFRCRFCCFVTEGAADVALEAFYEHCTTHTGEYRFHCNNCSYQAVAKASMKTHYYKVCRKNKTFNESASEDVIPREGGIYGYLCCSCNYVQLKRQNIEVHVEFWHREQMDTEILKINMSAITVSAEHAANNTEQSHESTSVNAEESLAVETKPQVLEFEAMECKDLFLDIARIIESENNDDNISECIPPEQKTNENIQVKEEKTEETPRLSQGEPEGSVSTDNLSVFVCPPELENKEMEIQRERQKTMQEIANNIGISLKNYSKPGLSIIDKLQDKMRTDAIVSPVPECNALANIPETKENSSLPFVNSAEPLKTEELIIKEDVLSQLSNQDDSPFMEEQLATEKSKVTNDADDKVDVKIRDPLTIMDSSKDNESDGENSDNERSAPVFESDSSSEQSDSEQTDVNMILKETSSMNASSSRGPMLTTIQRLAAQLQNAKPLEPVPPESTIDIKTEIKIEPLSLIPKPPDVVPIASVKHMLVKQNVKCSEKNMPTSSKNASSPKNFLRFRRLSGDMLSMPMQFLDNQEDSQEFNTDGAQSDSALDGLKTDMEEECSFLKIENVRSLAKSDPNENVTINDITKAVETSPTKSKEISVLRKTNQPLILKKISPQALANMNVQTPKMQSVTTPLASSSTSPSTLNYRSRKIKVIRMPVLNNSKDTSPASFVIKLKSMEMYATMLTEPKLAHFYKCMGQNCSFTTDSLPDYSRHYIKHYEEANEQNSTDNYDKCAYCYISTKDWNEMITHLETKHLHCRYQCGYCFYRAIVPSYVRQHQIMCHPNTMFYYLLDKKQKSIQKQEDINRNAYVLPFICKQDDCDKLFYIPEAFVTHLRTKHSSSHLMYKCHVCSTTHATIELLISHYKLHGFCKYQCLYCFYGSETLNEIHQHLSTFHYDRLAQVLERSLPLVPSLQKEVIHQLILRTFDDKIDEGNVNLSADNSNSKKNTSVSLNVGAILNETQSNQQQKNLKGDILIGTVSDLKNTEVNNVSNISTKQSVDTSLININKNTNNSIEKQLLENEPIQSETGKLSDYAINQILQKPKLDMSVNDSDAVDPLKISDEFNCSDEFLNTNLLDNADLLKNFTSNSDNVFSKSADKTEDSDIEILESEEKVAQCKTENKVKKKAELMFSETEVENKEQVAPSDTTEMKCTSKKAPAHAPANATAQPDKPLTLDDIKDTGRIGHELYKCGYLHECNFTAQSLVLLKAHIKTCNLGDPRQNLFCPHCKKRVVKICLFLEHIKTHGLKRFGCSLCKLRYSVPYQATAHMKSKHKFFHTKIVPADPTNPAVDGLFIVQAVPYEAADRRTKKRKRANKSGTEQEHEKNLDNEKLSFSPDEIERLPRQAIYNREVQCAVCPYTTKVRTNIIRHLQLHAKDETVPESGPVNPVPCLDKKEKMFDKMVNLASSSHQNGRMGAKPKESVKESEADDSIPKFVPEHKRYVCGVAECNYLTVDEAMLRYHLKALHSEEPYFRCPHCPPPSGQENQNIVIDKMGIHLKMHDARLYKCSHCNHHHYHRHVVERHLTDKHPEKRPFVKVIREMENMENVQQPVPEETEEEVPDPDGNHWKCNLCDFKCVYKADVATHADTVHGESSQYKCTLCSFKTSGKIVLEQHINSKHTYDSNADYTMMYQRIKGVNKRNTEAVEQGGQDEPFDTTPLWSRNKPRVRHIRGILLEEETETPATSETSSATSKLSLGKRKSDAEIVMKPAKIKVTGKSTSLDDNNKLSKEKSKRSLSCDKISGETEGEGHIMKVSAQSKVTGNKSAKDSMELIDGNDSDVGRFGPYGKPDANMYVCTLCNQFKTKYKHDMRDHLYRELTYARFHCKACGYASVNRKAICQHIGKHHNGEGTDEPLSPDNAIEDWVMTLLKKQTDMIKAWNHMNVTYKNLPVNTSFSSSDGSPIKISADKKSVNLASTISNLQNNVLEDANRSSIDFDDEDSRDNEDLVIDMKEDEMYENKSNEDKSENDKPRENDDDLEKSIICKHCQMSFTGQRGFKLHVQYSHLKRLSFLCPYCDRSTNSEMIMRQHIHAKHPYDLERIIHNPDAWGNARLNDEFWEKEYGLYPQKTKKRKLNTENNVSTTAASTAAIVSVSNRLEKCEVCNFTAVNYTGLRSHMRTHSHQHNLKCLYCTYSCSYKAEMVEHWESNHPSVPLKYTERLSAAESSSNETKTKPSTPQKQDVDTSKNEERDSSSAVIYGCVYCNLRSVSLPSIKQHWNLMHKDLKSSETPFATKFPFKFKEILVSRLPRKNPTKKDIIERNQAKQIENLSPVTQKHGWVCQWCQEFCETNNDRIRHHNMFHSHLPQKWKEQQQQQQKEQGQADTSVRLSGYSTEKYATNSKNISNFESVVENLITKHVKQAESGDMKNENDQNRNLDASTSKGNGRQAVARKSITKSAISYARPGPRIFKAVARKSTNPRYPPNFFKPLSEDHSTDMEYEEAEEIHRKKLSHYGIPSSPVNLTELNTYMVVGGHSMRVNCLTLATLINIKPKVILKDIRKDPKYTAIFSNLN